MASQTFRTDINAIYIRFFKWGLIAVGIFIVGANIYKFLYGLDVNYLNLFTGACFFVMGLFFNNYFGNISITIGDNTIRYHRSKTGIRAEEEKQYAWDNIKKVILSNRHIRVIKNNTTNKKFRLPYYTHHQFQVIKEQLHTVAEAQDVPFKVRSWW